MANNTTIATTSRQTAVFGVSDWKQIYQTYAEGNFQAYDFETLRKSFVDYLRVYYPETFNDYIESSELIALLDVMAFMGQALAFRTDLNTRENYLDTAERRDSVIKLAQLVSYTPNRNTEASGFLKCFSVTTTENVTDYNGVNLANLTINWADPSNFDWLEQWTTIINASLVSTQQIGRPGNNANILNVDTSEYTINLVPGFLPVVPYTATVDGINMPFEAINSTSAGKGYIYEPSPKPNGQFNVLFRNDQLGYASANTGFFFYFKQGVLQNQDFNLVEAISNRSVDINIEGINNDDPVLYQLDNVGTITTEWQFVQSVYGAAYEQLSPGTRAIFSVTSRTNDQITLNFGDGVFATIPVGLFRTYVRASNGLQYIINPEEMQSVVIPISYVSRAGNIETLTFTCGITQPVSNSAARETIQEIKQRAPAQFYTQNRMVNGEDYNLFPFSQYNTILKCYALNRASIGTSRYLELVDNTGKYSSTNTFAEDGALYEQNALAAFTFAWLTTNDIADAIINKIQPTLLSKGMQQFYYANFPRYDLSTLNTTWHESTSVIGETTGYFENISGNPQMIGSYNSSNLKYVTVGSLVKFVPPSGYYFTPTNRLAVGAPQADGDKMFIWASPVSVYNDGTNQGRGNFDDGTGPVILNTFVPTGAICNEVIPIFTSTFGTTVTSSMSQQIQLNRNFGLGYNNATSSWYVITAANLDQDANFSLANAGSTTGTNQDASWLIQCTTDGVNYTVQSRNLAYLFGSYLEVRFFYYGNEKIYDSRTGTVIKDFVNILKVNSQPDSNYPLTNDVYLNIIDQPVEPDGYVDDYQVLVSSRDTLTSGIPDDPDFFTTVVNASANPNTKLVFFQLTEDFDNLERYMLVDRGVVNSDFATQADIQSVQYDYQAGQVFYAYDEGSTITTGNFYYLYIDLSGNRSILPKSGFTCAVGRQSLKFQYRHNAPLTSRIDPGSTNIIDLYIVTLAYYTAYTAWVQDVTNTLTEPLPPTIDELSTDYPALQNYKMISDNLILNSVEFKPLFGAKAAPALRATIKVIPAALTNASNSEIKNAVLACLNTYFSIDKWNFGDTFYFSELAAYIHSQIGTIVGSVVLVPLSSSKSFGDLYEIRSEPNQIFVNGATVNDIEVITALTSANLQTAPGSGVI